MADDSSLAPVDPHAALQTLAHLVSKDLRTWQALPPMVSPTQPPGSASSGDACPDSGGLGTGSAAIVDGNPRLLFPAIHSCADGVRCFSQCVAEPANRSDPLLRTWVKRQIIDDRWVRTPTTSQPPLSQCIVTPASAAAIEVAG